MPNQHTALPMPARFWAKVDRRGPDECWPWQATRRNEYGYGSFSVDGRAMNAHRYSLVLATGINPPGLLACHTCDNAPCCNPAHLYWGSRTQNNIDAVERGRNRNTAVTHCPNGHEYNAANTHVANGRRYCRVCRRDRKRAKYAASRSAVGATQ